MQLRHHTVLLHFLFLLYFTCLSQSFNVFQQQNVRHQEILNQMTNNEELMIIGVRGHWNWYPLDIDYKHIAIQDREKNLKWR